MGDKDSIPTISGQLNDRRVGTGDDTIFRISDGSMVHYTFATAILIRITSGHFLSPQATPVKAL